MSDDAATDDRDDAAVDESDTPTGPPSTGNDGYDAWLAAVADESGYALRCPDGHASLPPRRVCPTCGATDLTQTPLAERGTVETASVVHVPSPGFAEDAPYVTAVVDMGPVRVTGVVRGAEATLYAVSAGDTVTLGVDRRETNDEPLIVFRLEVD